MPKHLYTEKRKRCSWTVIYSQAIAFYCGPGANSGGELLKLRTIKVLAVMALSP
ncbi:hypothetical protein [Neobacillus cucumis]|uniref:hypothetical protein n=1 Tax=Neobacillus cucumis TaxID=1740721 RepID=UPI002E20B03B|nr:hypothetical protein [Neobacillus cucumis]